MSLSNVLALAASFGLFSLSLHGCDSDQSEIEVDKPTCRSFGNCDRCDAHSCLECEIGFTNINGSCGFMPTDYLSKPLKHSALERKGLTLDDTTFRFCADKIPMAWPATERASVGSLRLIKGWQQDWNDWEGQKNQSWHNLRRYVHASNVSVLMGTQISCNETDDDRDWRDVKELIKILGPNHITGLAVGNEIELFHSKDNISESCVNKIWQGGYFWRKFQERVKDLDDLGMSHVPVTTVMGAAVLAGEPFLEDPSQALFSSWASNATKAYGERFIFSLNSYGYFDIDATLDEGTSDQCTAALKRALCLHTKNLDNCYVPSQIAEFRRRMQKVTGLENGGKLWLGETGWSSPRATTLGGNAWDDSHNMSNCPAWSSYESFEQYYENFLSWDLSLPAGVAAPDHVFYFSIRDSSNFGKVEGFGLVGGDDESNWCDLTRSKFDEANTIDAELAPVVNGDQVAEATSVMV